MMKFPIPKTTFKKTANCLVIFLILSIIGLEVALGQSLHETLKQEQSLKIKNDSLDAIRVVETNSLTIPQNIDFLNYSRIGFMMNFKEACISLNTSFVLRKYRTYDFGIGSGLEYYNRGHGFIQLIQIPFFISNHIYLSRKTYVLFEPGMMVPVSGFYFSDLTPTAGIDGEKIEFKDSELTSSIFYTIGLGVFNRKNYHVEFIMRNQSTGITYPIQKRVNMFGINLEIKL